VDLDLAGGPGLMVAKGRPAPPLVALEVGMCVGSRGALETSAV